MKKQWAERWLDDYASKLIEEALKIDPSIIEESFIMKEAKKLKKAIDENYEETPKPADK